MSALTQFCIYSAISVLGADGFAWAQAASGCTTRIAFDGVWQHTSMTLVVTDVGDTDTNTHRDTDVYVCAYYLYVYIYIFFFFFFFSVCLSVSLSLSHLVRSLIPSHHNLALTPSLDPRPCPKPLVQNPKSSWSGFVSYK